MTTATTITLPTGIELRDALAGIERLITAKEWERAAIVYAFTTGDDVGGRPTAREVVQFPESPCSIRKFAELGFQGLRTQDTVRRYRQIWKTAIDKGYAVEVHPGDVVDLPTVEWHEIAIGHYGFVAPPPGPPSPVAQRVIDAAERRMGQLGHSEPHRGGRARLAQRPARAGQEPLGGAGAA
jgi:hypothetical protein